ncbi:MAG: anti-sigma factor family protein [Myxococcota bacterium]
MQKLPALPCPAPDRWMDYALQELPPADQEWLEHHLRECAVCTLELQALQETLALVQQLPGAALTAPPPSEALLRAVEAQVPWHRRITRILWERISTPIPAYQAVLAGVAMLLVYQGLEQHGTDAPPRAPELSAAPIPVGNGGASQETEEASTPQTADALPSDQFANAW